MLGKPGKHLGAGGWGGGCVVERHFLPGSQMLERKLPGGIEAHEPFTHQVHASNSSVVLANYSLSRVRPQVKVYNYSLCMCGQRVMLSRRRTLLSPGNWAFPVWGLMGPLAGIFNFTRLRFLMSFLFSREGGQNLSWVFVTSLVD